MAITNHKKTRIINVRVSDFFAENLSRVTEIMKKEFNDNVTVSEAFRQLATASFILYYKNYTMKQVLLTLAKLYLHQCECGYETVSTQKTMICPNCGAKITGKHVFMPNNELLKIADKIPLVKIIEMLNKE